MVIPEPREALVIRALIAHKNRDGYWLADVAEQLAIAPTIAQSVKIFEEPDILLQHWKGDWGDIKVEVKEGVFHFSWKRHDGLTLALASDENFQPNEVLLTIMLYARLFFVLKKANIYTGVQVGSVEPDYRKVKIHLDGKEISHVVWADVLTRQICVMDRDDLGRPVMKGKDSFATRVCTGQVAIIVADAPLAFF